MIGEGLEQIGETVSKVAEAGAKAAENIQDVVPAIAETGTKAVENIQDVVPAIAEAPMVIGAVEQGMINSIDAAGGLDAVNPDITFNALANISQEIVPPTPEIGLEVSVPTGRQLEIPPIQPTDIINRDNQALVPTEKHVVPVDDIVEGVWRELPTDENVSKVYGDSLEKQIHKLIGKGSERWGEASQRQFVDAFSYLNSERVKKKVEVIRHVLADDPEIPFERIITSILYALTPEQVDSYLNTVELILTDQNNKSDEAKKSNQQEATTGPKSASEAKPIGGKVLDKSVNPAKNTPLISSASNPVGELAGVVPPKALGSGIVAPTFEGIASGLSSAAGKISVPVK